VQIIAICLQAFVRMVVKITDLSKFVYNSTYKILGCHIINKFAKFGSVGALGTVTNIAIFSSLTFLNVNYNLSSIAAFLVAVTQNYKLNKKWTFKDHNTKTRKKFPKYLVLNFFSFFVNLAVLNIVIFYFGEDKLIQIAGQIVGIGIAMIFNFLGSYLVIFAKNEEKEV